MQEYQKTERFFAKVSQPNRTEGSFVINPNKAGLFEGSFFWGEVKLTPSYFKKN